MKKFAVLVLVLVSTQDVWADWKNCYVKVTNPEFNNMIMAHQCIDFPDDMSESTYKMAKGLCEPQWDGMNVMVEYVPVCQKPSHGICRFTFPEPRLNFKYKIYYYSVPSVTSQDNKEICKASGGVWLQG